MTAKVDVREAAIPGAVDELLFGGKVRLLGFGKYYPNPQGVLEKQDWSLRAFNDVPETGRPRSHSIMRYLPKIARDYELPKDLYAPSPRLFNAQVCDASAVMSTRIMVTSDDYHNTVWLRRGTDADGMLLTRGHTYVVSPAGCPVLILYNKEKGQLGVAHAGMRSLFNEPALKGESDGRPYDSVVDNMLAHMGLLGNWEATKGLEAVIAFPIPASELTYPWDHPTYGELNKMRSILISTNLSPDCTPGIDGPDAEKGMISVEMMIRTELMRRGVMFIKTIYMPRDWYTTRESKEDELKRNLVLVQHL